MMKFICFFTLLSIIAVSSVNCREIPSPPRVVRAAEDTAPAVENDTTNENAVAASDDLDKAETFGFGFHKHVHSYGGYYGPSYYPYPRYYPHPGYYGGYGQYPHPGYYGYGGHPYYY
ncbi:uncharacterized protein LOC129764551 [Toxorhynchites rutilus septentrionalis]|uniref:uncharacterized protein LOC129764551 n=1 Tax=Toxorhynchites rutilus septentrionalis TaxID=329112 RepID=UPI002479D2D5|nr:uncharacterized protein LOC129764551 [Toxorhynchites rutilus septentrionalis]